jgi:hypothetical protein
MLWWMGVAAGLAQTFDEIGRSGLTSNATESLALVSEDLDISWFGVKVTDRFRYLGTAPREVRFAIYGVPQDASNTWTIADWRGDWMGLEVSQGAAPVPITLAPRALLRTPEGVLRDVTDLLGSAGLSLGLRAEDHEDAVARLSPDVLRMLHAQGLLGPAPEFRPRWLLQPVYMWSARVTPGAGLEVSYDYALPGAWISGEETCQECRISAWPNAALTSKYCVDSSGAQGLAARAVGGMIEWGELFFPLRGASQWAGSVGRLRIAMDKGAAHEMLSLCARGVKKVSDTGFVWERLNIEPDVDLHVLVTGSPLKVQAGPACGLGFGWE